MDRPTVIIKKYGNRRLYDSTNSRYVNLDEVAQMVREGRDVQVVDATTGEDRTRAVLTQIVIEQAKGDDDAAFPLDVLRQMVAATGRATNEAALTYMGAALDVYQNAYRAMAKLPLTKPEPPAPPAAEATEDDRKAAEAADLKKRIDELEAIVARISSAPPPRAARPKKKGR